RCRHGRRLPSGDEANRSFVATSGPDPILDGWPHNPLRPTGGTRGPSPSSSPAPVPQCQLGGLQVSKAKWAKVAEVREEWMLSGSASDCFRRPARKVKAPLRKRAVPLVEFTERDWPVRRSRVEGLVTRLERESPEPADQEDLQRD